MKLCVSHSRKIPASEEYSSSGFSCSLEVEVPDETARDTETLRSYLAELYAEAKTAVEQQLASVPRRNGNGRQTATGIFGRPNDNPPERRPGNSQGVATPKQISFLVSLGARNKLTFADLQKIAQERFKAEDLYRLSKQQASELIDSLKPTQGR